jgi:hypothetical protein
MTEKYRLSITNHYGNTTPMKRREHVTPVKVVIMKKKINYKFC